MYLLLDTVLPPVINTATHKDFSFFGTLSRTFFVVKELAGNTYCLSNKYFLKVLIAQ
jgi:hypothetical protein